LSILVCFISIPYFAYISMLSLCSIYPPLHNQIYPSQVFTQYFFLENPERNMRREQEATLIWAKPFRNTPNSCTYVHTSTDTHTHTTQTSTSYLSALYYESYYPHLILHLSAWFQKTFFPLLTNSLQATTLIKTISTSNYQVFCKVECYIYISLTKQGLLTFTEWLGSAGIVTGTVKNIRSQIQQCGRLVATKDVSVPIFHNSFCGEILTLLCFSCFLPILWFWYQQ
jgi:hypothetical protein